MAKTVLRDGVYRTLREQIISGRILPGAPLGEERLALELKVSRTPLREALRQLAEEGFVEHTPHKGARVLQLTPELISEVFLIRESLEGVAAREAAQKIDDAHMASLRQRFEALRPSVAQGDLTDVGDMIHEELFSICGNQRLQRLMAAYQGQVQWFQQVATRVPGRLLSAFREHESILSALESRDPEWAESVTRAHIRNTLRDLLASFDDTQGPGPERLGERPDDSRPAVG
jgi:DNA-binding GntR family transcriptional regulator